MNPKKQSEETKKPNVNEELEGLDITINSFGEIQSNYKIDKINAFLNKHVKDKKLGTEKESPAKAKKNKKADND